MSELLADLNPEQREAVAAIQGPCLILAGAGSGKTRVLTHRIAYLVEQGIRPWEILAVTFTNKAAGEMKSRVAALVGDEQARRILVSTFHAACMRFLRQDIELLGFRAGFTIYDEDDALRLLKQVCADLKVDGKRFPIPRIRYTIDRAKNQLLGPEELGRLPQPADRVADRNDPTPAVYAAYQKALKQLNAVDFGDLLVFVVRLWTEFPEVLDRYRQRYRYLLVDEYQDTNHAQYRLVHLLGSGSRNVAVVGDDDQSIYAFRGADVGNILHFQRDFPEARVFRLERNYRSTPNILRVAAALVRNNARRMEKEMWTEAEEGAPVLALAEPTEGDEAQRILDEIRRLRRDGYGWGDVAIIYRTNAASRAYEQLFAREGVPHVLVGARRFYERKEVRDILSWLRLVLNPADDLAFLRAIAMPVRGIGPKALEAIRLEADAQGVPMLEGLRSWAETGGRARAGGAAFYVLIQDLQHKALAVSPAELVHAAIEESGYAAMLREEGTPEARGRLENLEELVVAVENAMKGEDWLGGEDAPSDPLARLQSFLDRAALVTGTDELPEGGGHVTLLTAHLAKGLEFPIVFVTGMYEGGFPHFRALELEDDIEEERRLAYVAFTRARERLFLTRPRYRVAFVPGAPARSTPATASRFLREIGPDLLRFGTESPHPPPQVSAAARVQMSGGRVLPFPAPARPVRPPGAEHTYVPDSPDELQPGLRVLHPQFGIGVIRGREGPPANPRLAVHFDAHGRKVLFARLARLEIVLSG